jgi:hypothetical protein
MSAYQLHSAFPRSSLRFVVKQTCGKDGPSEKAPCMVRICFMLPLFVCFEVYTIHFNNIFAKYRTFLYQAQVI